MTRIIWTQRQDIGPSARAGASLAFDVDRSRTVLFGGRGANSTNGDTWEWEGAHWTQVQDSGPAARDTAVMAHGVAGVVLFGGHLDVAAAGSFRAADTWSWDGNDWTQLADTGPSSRNRASLVYDTARSRYILFGGAGDQGELGDTWAFDGSDWTQIADTGPSPRTAHAMAYAAAIDRVILFGGRSNGQTDGETWVWNGADWTQVQDVGPSARAGHVMAADRSSVWLFGGESALAAGGATLLGDSWEWNGSMWTQRQDIGPSPRKEAAAVFDPVRDRIVLFGGAANGAVPTATPPVGDTWEARAGDDSPAPVVPDADVFTIDASEAMVAGSDLGYVAVAAAAPTAADRPISVAVNGVPETVSSPPLRAGETGGRAFFRMTGRAPGTFDVQITVGASISHATVTVVAGQPLRDFGVTPLTVMRGGAIHVTIGLPFETQSRVIGIISTADGHLGQEYVGPAAMGPITFFVVLGPTVEVGTHRLIAVSKGGGPGISVAGFVAITVT